MEPRNQEKTDNDLRSEPKEAKPRRFQIVKLEERIAPSKGGINHTLKARHCYPY